MLKSMARKSAPRRGRPALTVPLYQRVAAKLRDQMKCGSWAKGSVVPSFQSLARQYKVGERVIRTAIEMLKREGWIAANARRRLVVGVHAGGGTTAGGVVLEILTTSLANFLSSQPAAELQRGVALGVSDLDAPLLIAHSDWLRSVLPNDLLQIPLLGIVLLWPQRREILPKYARLNVPVVILDRPYADWKLHAASVDNYAAARDATERLISLGHRRIAFLSYLVLWKSEPDPDARERIAGFIAAMKQARLWGPENRVFHLSDYDQFDSAPIQALLRTVPTFTAVLTTDPTRAQILLKAAQLSGRRIPQDLSVASFEGTLSSVPKLSGPRVDFADLARRGVGLLKKSRNPAIHLRITATWHAGETVGPPGG
jgi:DNA-binding LacI/PurR family transcriptional regulator